MVWRTPTHLLELRLVASKGPIWSHSTHFAWFPTLMKPVAQLSNVLHCPISATTHDAKVSLREGSKILKFLELSPSSSSFWLKVVTCPLGVYGVERVLSLFFSMVSSLS